MVTTWTLVIDPFSSWSQGQVTWISSLTVQMEKLSPREEQGPRTKAQISGLQPRAPFAYATAKDFKKNKYLLRASGLQAPWWEKKKGHR